MGVLLAPLAWHPIYLFVLCVCVHFHTFRISGHHFGSRGLSSWPQNYVLRALGLHVGSQWPSDGSQNYY